MDVSAPVQVWTFTGPRAHVEIRVEPVGPTVCRHCLDLWRRRIVAAADEFRAVRLRWSRLVKGGHDAPHRQEDIEEEAAICVRRIGRTDYERLGGIGSSVTRAGSDD
jgi:hypothetical protein